MAAVRDDIVRICHLDSQRVLVGNNAQAGNQLTVRKVVGKRCGEPHVDVEVGFAVRDQAVPAAVDTGPINPLATESLHVWVVAHVYARRARCGACIETNDSANGETLFGLKAHPE